MSDFNENNGERREGAPAPAEGSGAAKRNNYKKRYNNRHRGGRDRQNVKPAENAPAERAEQKPQVKVQPAQSAGEQTQSTAEGGNRPPRNKQNHNRRGGKNRNNRPDRNNRKPAIEAEEKAVSAEEAVSPEAPKEQPPESDRNQKNNRSRRNNREGKKPASDSAVINGIADYNAPAASPSPSPILFSDFDSAIAKSDDSYIDSMPPDPTLDAVFSDEPVPTPLPPDGPEIVGIRFAHGSKVYYFAPGGYVLSVGQHAIVETAQGVEYGQVVIANRRVPEENVVSPLRTVLRPATSDDDEHYQANCRREKEAFKICLEKIEKHKLEMKLVEAQYTFDNTKLIFFFTAAGRVDFRELVRDLASVFRTRIELRQIGIRDEAKMIGGFGVCGRKLCCSGFLPNFAQVSIKMAKEQGLSLNSAKISGTCGRLMCCLRFEQETYEREIELMPAPDSVVETADGRGVVIDISPISGSVRVKLNDKPDIAPKNYRLTDIRVITRAARRREEDSEE